MTKARNLWLDTLRAVAILAVVVYHLIQMSPLQGTAISTFTQFGRFGVDLFFVLSGWLIGTLFWREHRSFGNVELFRFWLRRALRTIPPYAGALIVSWAAVHLARGEPFDLGYLLFLQNYYERVPFFLVSWSLCIEEHFYAVAPVAASATARIMGVRRLGAVFFGLLLAPAAFRAIELPHFEQAGFGYVLTATHLRMDALIVGFGLSYASIFHPRVLEAAARMVPPLVAGLAIASIFLIADGSSAGTILAPLSIAALFGMLLIWGLESTLAIPRPIARAVSTVALAAYSTYLTHPLMLHAAREITTRMHIEALYWPSSITLVAIAGMSFWYLVEQPSIRLRDTLVARRNGTILNVRIN